MPDLATRAQAVLTKAQQLQAAEKNRQAEGQLAQRYAALKELQQRLQKSRDFESEWSQAGLPTLSDEASRTLAKRARDRVVATKTAQVGDPSSILDDTSFRILVRSVEQSCSATEAAAAAAWAHYSQSVLPPALGGDEQLLRADPRMDGEIVDRLIRWDSFLRSVAAKARPSPNELKEFIQVIAKRKELWATLNIEQDPEVVAFIRASGDQGAAMGLLTAKVATWLKERGLFDAYVIRKRA